VLTFVHTGSLPPRFSSLVVDLTLRTARSIAWMIWRRPYGRL
jgi:hypothetical protein